MDFDLASLANVAEIVGATTILTGLVFGWVQLRQLRIQQRDAIASELARNFYNPGLAAAIATLNEVPDGTGMKALREMGLEYEAAAVTVTTSFETMGVLVFKRVADLELVTDLAGGIITTMNRKLGAYHREIRQANSQPSWAEWFEWLADQVAKRKSEQQPAHVLHRDWRP